jgi:hypothetical protein
VFSQPVAFATGYWLALGEISVAVTFLEHDLAVADDYDHGSGEMVHVPAFPLRRR